MGLSLIILFFSGVVILGNATLNATERLVIPSVAQLIVPVTAIFGLYMFGSHYGVLSVLTGMVVGQLLNLAIVQFYLKRTGISLVPRGHSQMRSDLMPLWGQYFPLLASAFFAGIALPINTMLAATLPGGSVSAFNLGSKVVLFVSGLLGTVISSVMLPYFSSLVEKNGLHEARKELSLFLLIATFISVPASAVLYVWSEPVIRIIFERGTFGAGDVAAVSRVMQYAVIQIPFFVCNILLLKYATATRHSFTITIAASAGLLVNVALSLLLMPRMGASGIALAASISMLISSAFLVAALVRFGHISSLNAVVVLLNWMLFLTLLVSVHFRSPPSMVMVLMTYIVLLVGYSKLISKSKASFAAQNL
jgi:putative peptidoglycan lipid II flippase